VQVALFPEKRWYNVTFFSVQNDSAKLILDTYLLLSKITDHFV